MTLNPKITVNRRHPRAATVCAKIMEIALNHFANDERMAAFHRDLSNLVNAEGMEIITDNMRKEAGLEPRNENGCTPLELMLIEYFFMSRMLKPIIVQMPQPTQFELIKDDNK